jgi:cellulose 1,4-beta-cellobiosidase
MFYGITFLLVLFTVAFGQQVGTNTPENHPQLPTRHCTKNGCEMLSTSIVLDSNWRWLHTTSGYTNCFTGNKWDGNLCPDPQTCVRNCALDGADYQNTYGIRTDGNALTLKFVTKGQYGTNIGSRVYLLADENNYKMFHLKNQEFTFDVDVSNLPCGLNGALYFVEMDQDGGMSKYPTNRAGAKYGTGYCDAQCPKDIKFINGEANVLDWQPSPKDPNSGTGRYGTCCSEMDIWEANSISSAYTAHVCTTTGQHRCEGDECGTGDKRYNGVCDKDGCDFNSFRMGNATFYGQFINTKQKFTVITQFITSDNTTNGELIEIRRLYVQNGKVIQNSKTNIGGMMPFNSISNNFCNAQKEKFGNKNDFRAKGGLKSFGDALQRGSVLVMSLWDDHEAHMLWLDSLYPTDKSPSIPGVARGTCPITSGNPSDVESRYPNSSVTFSNIRFGDIGSTLLFQ